VVADFTYFSLLKPIPASMRARVGLELVSAAVSARTSIRETLTTGESPGAGLQGSKASGPEGGGLWGFGALGLREVGSKAPGPEGGGLRGLRSAGSGALARDLRACGGLADLLDQVLHGRPIDGALADVAVGDGPLLRDHEARGAGDVLADVLGAVGPDRDELGVAEDGEAQAELGGEGGALVERIGDDGDDGRLGSGEAVQLLLQLTELLAAMGSPVAAVEDREHGALSPGLF